MAKSKLGEGFSLLITLIGLYLLGAVTFLGLAIVLPHKFADQIYSMPIWGIILAYLALGYFVREIYRKLPEAKE